MESNIIILIRSTIQDCLMLQDLIMKETGDLGDQRGLTNHLTMMEEAVEDLGLMTLSRTYSKKHPRLELVVSTIWTWLAM